MNLLWEKPAAAPTVRPHRLRPYQEQAVAAVLREWESTPSTLLVMATGLGKSECFSHAIKRRLESHGGRALVLAHKKELIEQAAKRIHKVTGLKCDIEMADQWADMRAVAAPVIVSSVQTQNSGKVARMERFEPRMFTVLVIDEGHHAVSDGYRRIVRYYKENNPLLRILGVTATPDRADEEALGQMFDTTAYVHEINDGINGGWLVPILQRSVQVQGLDFSGLHTSKGDLDGNELAALMEAEEEAHGLVSSSIDLCGDRQTLIFSASVRHGEMICEILNRHRQGCARFVEGRTPEHDRRRMFEDYSAREYQFLVNVGVVTEGVDVPGIEVVVMGRPTKSRSLFAQMVGRGTRPLPGLVDGLDTDEQRRHAIATSDKPHLEVIDFVGNAGRHKLISTADILGGNYSEEDIETARTAVEKADRPVNAMEALAQAKRSREAREAREAANEKERKRRAHVKGIAHYATAVIDAFDLFDITPKPLRGWDASRMATEAQVISIVKNSGGKIGEEEARKLPLAHASQLIEKYKQVISPAMLKRLKKYNLPTDISRDQAKAIMGSIFRDKSAPWGLPPRPEDVARILGNKAWPMASATVPPPHEQPFEDVEF